MNGRWKSDRLLIKGTGQGTGVGSECVLPKYKTKLCDAYGVVQPEYVEVPDSLIASTRELKKFFDTSYAYVASLKPKPTKKKKS